MEIIQFIFEMVENALEEMERGLDSFDEDKAHDALSDAASGLDILKKLKRADKLPKSVVRRLGDDIQAFQALTPPIWNAWPRT